MAICNKCGEEIEFRNINGENIPLHPHGGWCEGYLSARVKSSTTHYDRDFCRPTKCPQCKSDVFFIRHNGGSVWVDELGWPWPRHACDRLNNYRIIDKLKEEISSKHTPPFLGLVIKSEKVKNSKDEKIHTMVRIKGKGNECRDVSIEGDCSELGGQLVTLSSNKKSPKLKTLIHGSVKSYDVMTSHNTKKRKSKIEKVKTRLKGLKVTFNQDDSYNNLKDLLEMELKKRTLKNRKLLEDKLRKLQIDFPSNSTNTKLRKLYEAKVAEQNLYAKRNSLLEKIAAKTGLTQNQVSSVLDEITVLIEPNIKNGTIGNSVLSGLVNIECKRKTYNQNNEKE